MKNPSPLRKLHPLESLGNSPAGRAGIRVERLEQRLKPRVPFPHKHDFFHLVHVERGSGWHEIDFHRFPVKRGLFYFVRPAEVHAWSLGKNTAGTVLEFTRASLPAGSEGILESIGALPAMGMLAPEAAALLPSMCFEFRLGQGASLEHLLSAFLLMLARQGEAGPARKPNALTEKLRDLVELHFRRQHGVEFYAKELGLSPKALTTKVKLAVGLSAGELIQERLLLEAKRLLAHASLSVAEVGYELGYDDPNYFARFFRQRAGMAPGKFRALAGHTIHA